jgi:hypothetical protein
VFIFEATVLLLVMVTICTLYPAGALELFDGAELLGEGELTEARRNEIRAGAIVSVGSGDGVIDWLMMF